MNQSHQENENMGAGRVTQKTYIIGFLLATLFTLLSFGLVVFAALLQMFVHLYYFLHLNKSSEQRWNVIALAFTLLLIFIFVGGTIWVMYTLNIRMM